MLQIVMILVFVAGYSLACAQDFVVTIKGDTLRGKVRFFNSSGVKYAGSNSKYIQLTPKEGKKISFQVLQVVSFSMNDEHYHTIKIQQTYDFMKVLAPGYLTLYAYQPENQTTWDGRYFVKKDGALLDVPNIGFKKKVSRYLADCPDVVTKIESGELERSDLKELVRAYNDCVSLKTAPKPVDSSPGGDAWKTLEHAVNGLTSFDQKTDVLDMIREAQNKISRNEAIPSFLINGIKEALKDQSSVQEALTAALETVKKN